jgi:cytochrome c oxidase assembly protein subunit 15
MSNPAITQNFQPHAVRLWLLAVAAMIFLTLLVGGATRLTESGLSIVEWKPVTGVLPPMTESGWQAAFEDYQKIPQYRELNRGMDIGQFKSIYWWEWSHRILARVTGAVFLLPFLMFLWRGAIPPKLRTRLWIIFSGGALLGVVGWWMVASGLSGTLVKVSQYRLAFHLTLACAVYAAVLWTAWQLTPRPPTIAPPRLRVTALAIVVLVLSQIYLGALVAGLEAGLIYNTWPQIDGVFVPEAAQLWFDGTGWRNLFENRLTVQFDHRMIAYAVFLAALFHLGDALRTRRGLRGATILTLLVTLQVALGIVTLLEQAPLPLALAHQALAIVVFTFAIVHAERLSKRPAF